MPGTSGHKLDATILGRYELMSTTACKAGTGKVLCLWVGHYSATDSSSLSLFPISPLVAPWTTSTLQSPTCLTHILRQASEPISTPLIMYTLNVKLNRRNMEFSLPWVQSPERSSSRSVSWHHYDWIWSNCIIMCISTVSGILQMN